MLQAANGSKRLRCWQLWKPWRCHDWVHLSEHWQKDLRSSEPFKTRLAAAGQKGHCGFQRDHHSMRERWGTRHHPLWQYLQISLDQLHLAISSTWSYHWHMPPTDPNLGHRSRTYPPLRQSLGRCFAVSRCHGSQRGSSRCRHLQCSHECLWESWRVPWRMFWEYLGYSGMIHVVTCPTVQTIKNMQSKAWASWNVGIPWLCPGGKLLCISCALDKRQMPIQYGQYGNFGRFGD